MDTFHAAITTLFSVGVDPELHQQATQWLNTFAATPEAWEAALLVLNDASAPSNVSFFAANVLLTKSRTEWGKVPQDKRVNLQHAVSAKLQQALASGSFDQLVLNRLAMVLAAMAVRGGPQPALQFLADGLGLMATAQQQAQAPGARCALAILTEVCSEAAALETSRASAVQAALLQRVPSVLVALQGVFTMAQEQQQRAQGGRAALVAEALRCLHAWSQDSSGMGARPITACSLCAESPALFSNLFPLLASEDATLADEAAGLLASLLSAAPPDEPSGAAAAPPSWRATAMAAVAHLAALRPTLAVPGEAGARAARGVARCGTALCDACAQFAAGALPTIPASTTAPHCNGGGGVGGEVAAALQLAEVMLACLSRPERAVADAALDYLINLNTIPVAQRALQLQSGVFITALPLLLQHAQYPAGFTTWDEEVEDEDSFTRFRDHQLQELLETTFGMLGVGYLALAHQGIQAARSWQEAEAGLYAVRAVNIPVKLRILGRDRVDMSLEPSSPEQLLQAAQASAVLKAVTAAACAAPAAAAAGPPPLPSATSVQWFLASPWVLKEACRLLAEYAAWFGKAHVLAATLAQAAQAPGAPPELAEAAAAALRAEVPLDAALRLALAALRVGAPCSGAGAQAFRNLCVRCAARLGAPDVLPGLVTAALDIIAPAPEATLAAAASSGSASPGQPHLAGLRRRPAGHPGSASSSPGLADDRELVIEGLGRVVAALPAESMGTAGLALTQRLVARAQAFAVAGTSGNAPPVAAGVALGLLASELQLLAAAIRFMDFPGNTPPSMPHPALQVLEQAWPVLSGVAQHEACQRDPDVVQALCDAYQRALRSARLASRELLPALVASVTAILASHPHPGCCNVLGSAVELFGEARRSRAGGEGAGSSGGLQAQALVSAVHAVTAAVQASLGGLASQADLVRALYGMVDLYFVFARETLLDSPALEQLVSFACRAVGLQEREPVAAALAFLTHVLGVVDKSTGSNASQHRARLEACMAAHGPPLVHALMMAVADSCPRQLSRTLSGLLYTLVTSSVWGPAVGAWLGDVLQAADFRAVVGSSLGQEELVRVFGVLTRQPPLPRGRFDAFVGDLSGVLRGEAESDVLVAYEM